MPSLEVDHHVHLSAFRADDGAVVDDGGLLAEFLHAAQGEPCLKVRYKF
ncbi:MAG: hypothetical protein LKG25_00940 [Prevotella sp.]|nr:hypothetical protein [Prevotella sp.]MCI1281143.1 hypothetical protein [Prevotella sp.]